MQITDLKKEEKITPLLRLGFRPFFLAGAIFSVIAILLWVLMYRGTLSLSPLGGAYWWHIHEMIFGFGCAIVAGFLLTAVQTWTSSPGVKGNTLLFLFLLWFAGRVALLMPELTGNLFASFIDLSFLPAVAFILAKPILAVKQYRNLFFVPLLILFTLANLEMHLATYSSTFSIIYSGYAALMLMTFLMSVMTGRVTPMFTANGTKTTKATPLAGLDIATNGSLAILMFSLLLEPVVGFSSTFFGVLLIIAGTLTVSIAQPVAGDYQSKLTLMSESLRNDGRIWVPKKKGETRKVVDIPEDERDYYLERKYPSFGNLSPRDISSRSAKEVCDEGRGIKGGEAVHLDFADAINRLGENTIRERYGNLFDMYETITGENPYKVPMQIYPAPHYTMGGTWVDYNLMSTVPGLFVLGEANFSDHGANRLGASALMQGLADGYFVAPYTISNYLAADKPEKIATDDSSFVETEKEVDDRIKKLLSIDGKQTVDEIHKRLGRIMWNKVGMGRNEKGLNEAIKDITELREEFWKDVKVVGKADGVNQTLERAGRLVDYLELGELMARDALDRKESCGGHFREEYQTDEGEAMRNDEDYAYAGAWEYKDVGNWELHKEPLEFEYVKLATRSYK